MACIECAYDWRDRLVALCPDCARMAHEERMAQNQQVTIFHRPSPVVVVDRPRRDVWVEADEDVILGGLIGGLLVAFTGAAVSHNKKSKKNRR